MKPLATDLPANDQVEYHAGKPDKAKEHNTGKCSERAFPLKKDYEDQFQKIPCAYQSPDRDLHQVYAPLTSYDCDSASGAQS